MKEPKWLQLAKELQAIAQIGLAYSADSYFDAQRYERIREIAAEIMACDGKFEKEFLLDLFSRESGYATPKVDVRGVAFEDDKVLLVKETSDGLWTLPGGWADVNESPRTAVEREVWEESGFKITAKKILAVYDRSLHEHTPAFPFHVYKLFFLCEITGGCREKSYETEAVEFFAENNLPPLSVSRVTEKQIRRFFEHLHRDDLPTDFD